MIVVGMLYNPPWRHVRPYTYVTSGSATQSTVIGGGVSCLQMMTSPVRVADTRNTHAWGSQFYRRAVNDFTSPDVRSPLSTVCGQYCVAFLIFRCRDASMNAFTRSFTTDLVANDCRVFDWVAAVNKK